MWAKNGNVQDWCAKFSGKPMVWGDKSTKNVSLGDREGLFAYSDTFAGAATELLVSYCL